MITYPESLSYPDQDQYFAINAVVEKNRLYVYYYYDNSDNGIQIYNLSNPLFPQLLTVVSMDGSIHGGMLGNRDMLASSAFIFGQFAIRKDHLIFTQTPIDLPENPHYPPDAFVYRYNVRTDELTQLSIGFDDVNSCEPDLSNIQRLPVFYFFDSERVITSMDWRKYTTPEADYLKSESVCYSKITELLNDNLDYRYGTKTGPMVRVGEYVVARWYNGFYRLSGVAVLLFSEDTAYIPVVLSDYYYYYLYTHISSDPLGNDKNNIENDVQDLLVHNGEIYLSCYWLSIIAHTYLYQDWGDEFYGQSYWKYHELPETATPYGITAANGTLYVAGQDKRYDFPLAKPDTELPVGDVYSAKADGTTFNISGWAEDSEGIRQVTVRLDHAYQYLADRKQGVCVEEEEEETGGHTRPVDPCRTWSLSIPLADLDPGTYTMKVVAEDMDGDFSVIHEELVQVPATVRMEQGR